MLLLIIGEHTLFIKNLAREASFRGLNIFNLE